MKEMKLKTVDMSLDLLRDLEDKGLIGLLKPTAHIEKDKSACTVDEMYSSSKEYGTHKMICVRKNSTDIQLTTHPENEEVIFIDYENRKFKPLYLVIATCDQSSFEKKAEAGSLCGDDILAVKVKYNDPLCSIFTVRKDIPHCEVTVKGGEEAPIFYVTEPTEMTMAYVDSADYSFLLP